MLKNPKKIIAFGLIGVATLDLLFGDSKPVLPDALGNVLTQQIDAVLIGVGVLLLVM